MSGLLGGGSSGPTPETYAGMQVSTSIMGQVIPYITGRTRIPMNLAWYGNFQQHGSGSSSKGGGAPTSYTYSAAFIGIMSLGPINGVFQVFHDRSLVNLTYENLSLALGGATFQGSISGTTLTVHGIVAGAIEVGGTLSGAGIGQGITIVSGSGTSWVLSSSPGTIATESMYVSQPVWTGYPSGTPSNQQIAYSALSYLASPLYNFGSSASMPNLTFETEAGGIVSGYSDANALYDASCDNIITDYLTNPITGAGFLGTINSALLTGATNTFQAYCMALGIMLSLKEDNQRAATDCMKEIMQITNSDFVLSCGVLKVIPYADTAVSGTTADGANWSYTPNLTPVFAFTDNDYCPNTGADGRPTEEPVKLKRKAVRDTFNIVNVEYLDRSNYYNPAPATASDNNDIAIRGPRCMPTVTLHEITNAVTAKLVAGLILNWQLYERNTYTFRVRYDYWQLEPMDYISITEGTGATGMVLKNQVCRITEIAESEDNFLTITCMEVPGTIRTTPLYNWSASQGYVANFDAAPGHVQAPAIFAMPPIAAGFSAGITLGIAVCAPSSATFWGGCYVYASVDGGTTYDYVGRIGENGPARYGTLTANLPLVQDPDTTSTLAVLLANTTEQLSTAVTHAEADAAQTLLLVGSGSTVEVMAYGTGTLTGAGAYNLTYLRRGLYQTNPNSQTSGAPFVRLDASIFTLAVDPGMAGQTITFKFCSFNTVGRAVEALSAVTAYNYVIPANFGSTAVFNSTWESGGTCAMLSPTSAYKLTTGATAWDSSIYSAQAFTNGCTVQCYATQTNLHAFIGLTTNPTASNSYTNLAYAMEMDPTGHVIITESGTAIGTFGTYTTSTLLQIVYDGKHVSYYVAGTMVRTVPILNQTFFAQFCFDDPGCGIYGMSFSSSALAATGFTLVPMTVNVAAAGNKAASNANGTNGAYGNKCFQSKESFSSGAICSYSMSPVSAGGQVLGLSTAPATGDTTGVGVCIAEWSSSSSACKAYYNGTAVTGTLSGAVASDVFTIEYDLWNFYFYRNTTLVATAYSPQAGPLYLFGDFFNINSGMANIVFANNGQLTPNPFVANGNAVTHDSTATKIGGTGAWDSAVWSLNAYAQCHVQAKTSDITKSWMLGLSTITHDAANDYTQINYAWYESAGTWLIYESGTAVVSVGAATVTDLVAVTYDGSTIKYYLNGTLERSVSVSGLTLYASGSLFDVDAAINSLSFGPGTTLDTVPTASIDPNAVSTIGSANSASAVTSSGAVNVNKNDTVISITVTCTGGPVEIDASCTAVVTSTSGGLLSVANMKIFMDGTAISGAEWDPTNGGLVTLANSNTPASLQVTLVVTNTPAAGSHTFSLVMNTTFTNSGSGNAHLQATNNFIKVREIKR